ncbi:MAG: prephenate dehydratase [Armatimonadota bacterium]|nr:prephenate dehydratase [Armatimonadota bacterium]MCX7776457.1 prephenate dehydratase [Armatimonadota bacterium]MDW8024255.1 prephenate dehydratase [Armatimonadota bacterium]
MECNGDWQNRLEELRKEIDEIDEKILSLLNRRAQVAISIGAHKRLRGRSPHSPSREAQILNRLLRLNEGPLPSDSLKAIYREILSACRKLEGHVRVAYLGPEFSYTDLACRQYFGHGVELYPVPTIQDVFYEVERDNANYGVVPVENTAEGEVNDTLDMFTRSNLKICAETLLPIHHCLMANCSLEEIKVVYSRDSALAQCKGWLSTHLPSAKLCPVSSTAEGAMRAASEPNAAAIGHILAAEHYGLKVLASNIEDMPGNKTRFLVIGKDSQPPTGQDKTSILFSVAHRPGTLYRALGALQRFNINMTMIASRPARHTPWEYLFFVDFQGHVEDEPVKAALEEMRKECLFLKVLGSYPEAIE